MSVTLTINDKTSNGELLLERIVNFPVERISVRELVETRVRQEAESYNQRAGDKFEGLVEPCEAELMLNGEKSAMGHHIDADKQVETAIRAFESGRYFLLINDRQIIELDDVIVINPNTKIVFLKILRLVGG
jgi:hypothetical protein